MKKKDKTIKVSQETYDKIIRIKKKTKLGIKYIVDMAINTASK